MENLKNLEKIAKIFQPQNIITSEEIDQVLKGIMEILASYKKGTDAINEETKAVVNILLDKVVQSNKQTIDKAEIMFDDRMTDLETLLKDVKQMITDVETLASEVKDGKDADEEKIVEDVISRIKIDPTVVTVSAQEIKDKLSSLEGDNKLDISAVKGFELYSTKVDLDYAIKTLQHQTSFLINKGGVKSIVAGTNITVDNTDPSNPIISSTGGGGSIAIGDTITSATQGSVLFAGASGVLAQDNSNLFWDDTNNVLGVGTASPLTQTGNRLQVGDNSASNQYLVFQTSNGHDRGIHYYLIDGTTLRGYMKWDLNEDLLLKGDVTFISTQNLTNPFTFMDSGGAGIGLMGIGTTSPTHSLTLNSTATGIALYNTADQTTNYERVQMYWTGNVYTIQTQKGGSGSNRNLTIGTVSRVLQFLESPTGTQGFYTFSNSTGGSLNALSITTTRSNSASVAAELTIQPTYNQSTTAGYTCLLINPTETTTGSGTKSLILAQVGSVDKFSVANTGITTITNTNDAAASNQILNLKGARATPTANDEVYQSFSLNSSTGVTREFGRITMAGTTVTNASEVGAFTFSGMNAGTLTARLVLSQSTLRPNANDGLALGTTTQSYADLFLASGGVINFNNGNVVLTHSTGILTQTAGEFRITSANVGTNADSVPTLSSTSTLTNKTISGASNTITNIPVSALSFSGAKAYRTTDVSLTTSTWTTIDLDNETYDTDTYHDNVTNPSRITIPSTAKYRFTACAEFTANKGHGIRLLKNGSAIEGASSTAGNSGVTEGSSVVWEDDFTSADYIQVQVVGTTASTSCTYASLSVQKLS